MATLDFDLVRHALDTARKAGLDEVELELGDSKFSAVLDRKPKKAARAEAKTSDEPAAEAAPTTKPIKAGSVGIFRTVGEMLKVDTQVASGEVVGNIIALGLSNDVTANINGVIREVLVEDGQAVEYGQVIATVEIA
jgi:acetyl-CoA carboxylase biotin carboxyl carrier protein